jgi:hypothetical protein
MTTIFRLVEEADFKSTTELFAKKGGEQKSLETFIPKSESDFAEYAELIANKLRPYEVCLTLAVLCPLWYPLYLQDLI